MYYVHFQQYKYNCENGLCNGKKAVPLDVHCDKNVLFLSKSE